MNNVRNIVLIGRTGNGKSTLGNVLINKDSNFQEVFKEGEFGVSQTHDIGIEEFEENGIRYRIIDTIGIGDTKLSEKDVLYKISEAAYKVRDGLNQILFITSDRFTKEEIEAYNLLRTVIFDREIVKFTTIVRTKFSGFRNYNKCQEDISKMLQENSELTELISGCKKVIHVNNIPKDVDDETMTQLSGEYRGKSRNIMMIHLMNNCQAIYKPQNLDGLNARIGNHMTDIESLQKQLREAKDMNDAQRNQLQNEINELRGKVSQETKGWCQRAVGAVGEGVG
jgi:hypothetical protein